LTFKKGLFDPGLADRFNGNFEQVAIEHDQVGGLSNLD
jgi:hypothetical protein